MTLLVDTSVLKRLGRREVRQVVEPLGVDGQLARATICDLEIGYSARNATEWDLLVGALNAFSLVETTTVHACSITTPSSISSPASPARAAAGSFRPAASTDVADRLPRGTTVIEQRAHPPGAPRCRLPGGTSTGSRG